MWLWAEGICSLGESLTLGLVTMLRGKRGYQVFVRGRVRIIIDRDRGIRGFKEVSFLRSLSRSRRRQLAVRNQRQARI